MKFYLNEYQANFVAGILEAYAEERERKNDVIPEIPRSIRVYADYFRGKKRNNE